MLCYPPIACSKLVYDCSRSRSAPSFGSLQCRGRNHPGATELVSSHSSEHVDENRPLHCHSVRRGGPAVASTRARTTPQTDRARRLCRFSLLTRQVLKSSVIPVRTNSTIQLTSHSLTS